MMMGALQVQSNGDGGGGGDGLLADDPGYVEVDPTGRYGRYNEILGKGSSKTVYRAFDEHLGMEVAWNHVAIHDFLRSPGDLERLYGEIHLLKTLRHRAVMRLHASWVAAGNAGAGAPRRRHSAVCFVTELFTSGTLRQYRRRHRRVRAAAVRSWCRQILEGLAYLHSRGVVHRDLKCDNIFVNGSQGQVKIGDLGLAAVLHRRRSGAPRCVVGTPEFMAPEVYAEDYDELADVYSFGMCVLEMVTLEYPYSECAHPVQIYKKVTSGIKPAALYKVKDPAVRRFIEKCLAPATRRPAAAELLGDPFLQVEDDGFYYLGDNDYYSAMYNYLHQPACLDHHHHAGAGDSSGSTASNGGAGGGDRWDDSEQDDDDDDGSMFHGIDQLFNEHEDDEHVGDVDITIKGKRMEDGSIFLRLRIADKDGTGRVRNIYFPFDAEADTALSVATEMVAELDITDHEVTHIADMIDGEVAALLPHWRPGPGMDDDGDDATAAPPTPRTPACCKSCRDGSGAASSGGSSLDEYMSAAAARRGCRCAELHGRFEEITFQADGDEPAQFQSSGSSSDDGGGQAEQCPEDEKLVGINGVAEASTTD